MNKKEFLATLKKGLKGLSDAELSERLLFYSEMIDDRMEEGLSEEQAVAAVGSVGDIISQAASEPARETPAAGNGAGKRRLRGWEIALIILGFPLWFPLLVAGGAILLALLAVLWSLVISAWAVEVSLWAGALGGFAAAVLSFVKGIHLQGVACAGIALLCAGLSVFVSYLCVAATKGAALLTGKIFSGVVSIFTGRRKVK